MFYLLAFVVLTLTFVYYLADRNNDYWKKKSVRYEKPLPLIGNMLPLLQGKTNINALFANLYRKFDAPYFGAYVFNSPCLILKDPEIIKQVMIKDFNYFPNRSGFFDENIDPVSANTIFTAKGSVWKTLRSKITPAFSSGKIKLMVPLISKCGEQLDQFLRRNNGKVIQTNDVCRRFTTNAVASCAFGIDANSFNLENSEFYDAGKRMFATTFERGVSTTAYLFAPFLVKIFKLKFLDPIAIKFFREVFWTVVEERQKTQAGRSDLVDLLIEARKSEKVDDSCKLDDTRMLAQAVTFFTAGMEPVASTMTFALYELALHPDIQENLRQQIDEAEKEHNGLIYQAIEDLKYLDMVLCEVLRKYPVAAIINRYNTKPYTIEKTGLALAANTQVYVSIMGLHYDERYYPNPQKFDPNRFSEESKRSLINAGYYMPFGIGPRNCIGERFAWKCAKLALVHVLKGFRFEACENTPKQVKYSSKSIFLTPERDIPLVVKTL